MKKYAQIISLAGAGAVAYFLYRLLAHQPAKQTNSTTDDMGKNTTTPRGYRNNNPLNIRYNPANEWKGKKLPNTDGVFEQFVSMEYGYRAAIYLIKKYINSGVRTVSEIISKWAPTTENNTAGYINRVCNTTGFTPGDIISRKEQIIPLVYAMAIVENGTAILPDYNEIEAGWNLL